MTDFALDSINPSIETRTFLSAAPAAAAAASAAVHQSTP
jgi:hypothetical protein